MIEKKLHELKTKILRTENINDAMREELANDIFEIEKLASNTEIIGSVSGSFIEEAKKLLLEYRDKEMPDWNSPFHYDAEGWSSMKYFMYWLEKKSNNR